VMPFLNSSRVDDSEFSTPNKTQVSPDLRSFGNTSPFLIMSSHLACTNQVFSSAVPFLIISSARSLARLPAPKLSSVNHTNLLPKFLWQNSISSAIRLGVFSLHFPCQCRHCVQKEHSCEHPLEPSIKAYLLSRPAIMAKWYLATVSLTRW